MRLLLRAIRSNVRTYPGIRLRPAISRVIDGFGQVLCGLQTTTRWCLMRRTVAQSISRLLSMTCGIAYGLFGCPPLPSFAFFSPFCPPETAEKRQSPPLVWYPPCAIVQAADMARSLAGARCAVGKYNPAALTRRYEEAETQAFRQSTAPSGTSNRAALRHGRQGRSVPDPQSNGTQPRPSLLRHVSAWPWPALQYRLT